jgi:aminopeptidase N
VLTFAAGPARDFYLAAAQNLAVVSQRLGETTINSYSLPEWEGGADLALEYAKNALDSFNQRFGAYPYTEFDIISTPMLALGIEYPGMTAIRLSLYDPDAEVYGLPSQVMLESTVAHEVAHQWFYNAVGNDQVDEPWLDEALVQYVTSLYFLDTYDEAAARVFRGGWDWSWKRVNRAEIPIGLPSRAYAEEEYSPIVYGRGPYFIAALAEEMGHEAWDEFLRDYYRSYKWGIGTGDAFRQLAERHCECDLSDLFEAWVYGN